jgi:hypothetical protein
VWRPESHCKDAIGVGRREGELGPMSGMNFSLFEKFHYLSKAMHGEKEMKAELGNP